MRIRRLAISMGLVLGGALLATSTPAVATDGAEAASIGPFVDVPSSHRFAEEIYTLAEAGISTGYVENGVRTFRPSSPVLREQMAAFLYRVEGEPPVSLPAVSPFRDVSTRHAFYPAIVWLYESGISTGYVENGVRTFRPSQPVLREQMAAFLCRAVENLPCRDLKAEYEAESIDPFPETITQVFSDVRRGHAFFDAIWYLHYWEISTGYEQPGSRPAFRPAEPVLREQMAAFIVRAFSGRS